MLMKKAGNFDKSGVGQIQIMLGKLFYTIWLQMQYQEFHACLLSLWLCRHTRCFVIGLSGVGGGAKTLICSCLCEFFAISYHFFTVQS